jgi:hypothetical protein
MSPKFLLSSEAKKCIVVSRGWAIGSLRTEVIINSRITYNMYIL